MEQQPAAPRLSIIDTDSDNWIECVMTAVWDMLDKQCDGTACITTPSGRAAHVTVRFGAGGSA